jgi:hypothetical protein
MSTSTGVFIPITPSLLIISGELETCCERKRSFGAYCSQFLKNRSKPSGEKRIDVAVAKSRWPESNRSRKESCRTSVQTLRFLKSALPPCHDY